MNLSQYDIVCNKIDKTKTWVDIDNKILYSREIKPVRKYYTYANRYNVETNDYSWYVILLDERQDNITCFNVRIDDYGRTKLNIGTIIKDSPFRFISKSCNISIAKVDDDIDGDVYQFLF